MLDEGVDVHGIPHGERDGDDDGERQLSPHRNSIVTPEAVAVSLDVAELGSRLAAYLIDLAIQVGVLVAVTFLATIAGSLGLLGIAGSVPAVALSGFVLLVLWGYFPFFEEVWGGRTPGKRAMGLRVIQTGGRPVGLGPVLLRNLLRPLDLLIIGPLLILFTRRHQRLGDLAAGTLVVRQARVDQPRPVGPGYAPNPYLPPLDTAGLSDEEYGLIRSFLERRFQLDPGARFALGSQLGDLVRAKVQGAQAYVWGDEVLLEAVLTAVRWRSQGV